MNPVSATQSNPTDDPDFLRRQAKIWSEVATRLRTEADGMDQCCADYLARAERLERGG